MSDMLREVQPQVLRIADMLRQRGQKIAIADGATGGLVSAALLTVPGALDFYVGGGVVYSFKARDALFGLPREAYRGMRSVTENYAILQADAIRHRLGADWGLAESGSAGGSAHPMGVASGRSIAAVADPSGRTLASTIETDDDDRIANMEAFAHNALDLLEQALSMPS